MSEQEVIFSTVRFHKSSGLQNPVRLAETQGPRKAGPRVCSVPWKLIMIALGILFSLRLVIFTMLVTNIFQYSQEKHELQESLINLHHNCSIMQNDIDLKEELLRNKFIECNAVNEFLESLNKEQNIWYSKTKTVLNSSHHTGIKVEVHWFCYGINCYYFIMNRKTWGRCKQTCQNSSLSLLKIDDELELKFLQLHVPSNSYWIGLSYDNRKNDWAWIDSGPSKLKVNFSPGGCVFLSKARLENTNCDNYFPCICGKRLDKFPG
ncbi:killer cell lectin-like receptor 4 [Apodemus sylvaticus]|uniref:killer cell lectin-like receptor 4 n=1 Tax=Apodemus sylvaticus TaxID=10129 RepID=UPI0022430387|nr:killer cell lectin-like receptor 4 [Apodemus sylvaticus]XP_052031037.1 killer cell lectin-like receptor 4 [Apodemus sylvaticus]